MNDRAFLSVFTPSRTAPEDLEAIFVQREAMLADAVERVRESAMTGNKHHQLFVGPRGTGKTHLVTLLVYRLSQDTTLQDRLHIAWLNEDETSTNLLEFLRRIYLALVKRHPGNYSEAALEPMYERDAVAATLWLENFLLQRLQNRTLLVVVENLDALFEGLGAAGQKQLRAFIQEHPVFAIVATAQRLVDDIAKRSSVFFGFFQTEPLETLSVEEAAELLGKIAKLNGQREAAAFLRSPLGRARIRALHHLSGGNHRIYLVLSQFITDDNIDALVIPFTKMIDEMTPYYQERIRWLPPQQRKIVEHLCLRERPAPVKDLAKRLFATSQSISSQLMDLRGKGYVLSAQRGRESLYEIAEPLMRLCVEVKENQTREPMRLLVDFLRVWYDERGLSSRLQGCDHGSLAHAYLQAAVEKNAAFGNLRAQLLVEDFRSELGEEKAGEGGLSRIESYARESEELAVAYGEWLKGDTELALSLLGEIAAEASDRPNPIRTAAYGLTADIYHQQGALELAINALGSMLAMADVPVKQVAAALYNRGVTYGQLGDHEKAMDDFSAVIALPDVSVKQVAKALINRGVTYAQLGDHEKAMADYSTVIALPDAPVEQVAKALCNRGVTYRQLGDQEKAMADYSAVIALPDAPVEQVAAALYNRGVTYGELGDHEKAMADYSTVIALPDAPVEQVASALLNRGVAYGQLGDQENAMADYSAVIGLPDAPVEQVGKALYNRGVAYCKINNLADAEQYFESVLRLVGVPIESCVDAQLALAQIRIAIGCWEAALATLADGLTQGTRAASHYLGNSVGIVAAFFTSSLAPNIRRERAGELFQVYAAHDALTALGEALTRHLGSIYRAAEGLPTADNLELWATAWEDAGQDNEAFRLPLRLFRTGIDFLKAGGKDRGILLDLNQEERKILEQSLGLD